MKTFTLTLLCLLAVTGLFAQKIELSVQANSGLFHYSGKSATKQSFILATNPNSGNYTNNPYGNNNGFSYGGYLQAQLVSKGGFIAGAQAGYDVLRSKADITGVVPVYNIEYLPYANYTAPQPVSANGQTYLKSEFINFSPYIGYRIKTAKIKIDLMPGLDFGFSLSSREKGKAITADGSKTTYQTNVDRGKTPDDVRLKFGAAAIYNRFGLTASYAHGITNYESKMIGGSPEAHSELVRLGLSYRIF